MGIVRPVLEVYPYAWLFFIPFVVITSFAVLNLFIALLVNSMNAAHEEEAKAAASLVQREEEDRTRRVLDELAAMRAELSEIRRTIR